MRTAKSEFKEKPACTVKYAPVPEFITCPECGEEIEFWTDEEETTCFFCNHRVFKNERTVH